MSGIHAHAIRFADLWAVDHHQMVDETYAPTIHMESMGGLDHAPVDGTEQLHALEDRLALMIPEHRHELVRVVAEDRHACLETTVVGPTTGEYAPACVWWWLDDRGLVASEVGWFDWDVRTTDSRRSRGFVPPNDGRPRGDRRWYRDLVDALVTGAMTDLSATRSSLFAPECVVERVGGTLHDAGDPAALGLPPAEWWVDVNEVAGNGAVIAVLFTLRTADLVSRGTAVLTLDEQDRVVSLRLYWTWFTAVAPDAVHPAIHLGRSPR